jgi:hypothetical protein
MQPFMFPLIAFVIYNAAFITLMMIYAPIP